jgi:hypothetical protein
MRRPRKIDLDRLTELWNREPHLSLAQIAEEMSTPELRLSTQQVSSYAHRYGLKKRKEYNTRTPGSPRGKYEKTRSPSAAGAMVRCPRCLAQVPYFSTSDHVCPDARIVERLRQSYTARPEVAA